MAAKEFKSKNAARRAAKKQQKAHNSAGVAPSTAESPASEQTSLPPDKISEDSVSRHDKPISVLDDVVADLDDPDLAEFKEIFHRFQSKELAASSGIRLVPGDQQGQGSLRLISSDQQGQVMYDEDENIPDEDQMLADSEQEEEKPLSKTKKKRQNRLTVAELKQLVKKPEVVEWTDVTAPDPKLLVSLKSVCNAVPVPTHWNQKRDYLSGKRGLEKTSFVLPDFIDATGVGSMRQAAAEQREQQSLKQQMRARVQPKMGRLDIDYQKLHDAFFRFQTKPPLTKYGETYYEGKEYETNTKEKRPGELSEELIEALNIPPGAPPPWLVQMQRYGPPPSYPSLRIPGLNAPIPSGAQWGFHAGGWGKPPVNEHNKPLYGDPYGILQTAPVVVPGVRKEIDLWGELEIAEEESEEEEEEEEEEESETEAADVDGEAMTEGIQTGLQTGMGSMAPSGIATPDHIELRKARASEDNDEDGEEMEEEEVDFNRPRQLYQVLPEQRQNVKGGFFAGSGRSYAMPATVPVTEAEARSRETMTKLDGKETRKRSSDDVNLAIDPENLEAGMSKEELEALYARGRAEKSGRPAGWDESLADMVSEQAVQAQKRQKLRSTQEKKKEKFKF